MNEPEKILFDALKLWDFIFIFFTFSLQPSGQNRQKNSLKE